MDSQEQCWDDVYNARERFYAERFGPFPDLVHKLMNLSGVWPGGCLIRLEATKLNGVWITSSFGLTNPDMPATTRTDEFGVEDTEDGRTYTMRCVAREPRDVPSGLAGYGYEILVVTRQQEEWPLMFLNWAVQMEILRDVEFLDRVQEIGAVTVEDVQLGEDMRSDFIIGPALPPFPAGGDLPNGRMNLLIATAITREGMEAALHYGQAEYLRRLMSSAAQQTSTLRTHH
jgi:hypothetical protein